MLKVAAVYFALLVAGECLIIPLRAFFTRGLGIRDATLMTVPFVAVFVFLAARAAVNQLGDSATFARRAGIALMPLLLIPVESVLRSAIGGLSLEIFDRYRDPVTKMLYVAILAIYVAMPLMTARRARDGSLVPELRRPRPQSVSELQRRHGPPRSRWNILLPVIAIPLTALHAWLLNPDRITYGTATGIGVVVATMLAGLLTQLRRPTLVRSIYTIGVTMILATAVLYPLWRGVRYVPWSSGTGVDGNEMDVDQRRAFLWRPPLVFDQTAFREAPVHWPADFSPDGVYAEPLFTFSIIHALLGVTALGLIVGWWYRGRSNGEIDALLHIALAVSTTLLGGWLCLLVIGVASLGYILFAPRIILAILIGSIGAGVVWALWSLRRTSDGAAPRDIQETAERAEIPTTTEIAGARESVTTTRLIVRIAIALISGWMALNVIGLLAMISWFPAAAVISVLLLVAIVGGIRWVVRDVRRSQPTTITATRQAVRTTNSGPSFASSAGSELFRFGGGLLLAVAFAAVLLAANVWIAPQISGVPRPMFFSLVPRSPESVAVGGWAAAITGLVLAAVGWGFATYIWPRHRAVAAGVATGATALSVMILTSPPFLP